MHLDGARLETKYVCASMFALVLIFWWNTTFQIKQQIFKHLGIHCISGISV